MATGSLPTEIPVRTLTRAEQRELIEEGRLPFDPLAYGPPPGMTKLRYRRVKDGWDGPREREVEICVQQSVFLTLAILLILAAMPGWFLVFFVTSETFSFLHAILAVVAGNFGTIAWTVGVVMGGVIILPLIRRWR